MGVFGITHSYHMAIFHDIFLTPLENNLGGAGGEGKLWIRLPFIKKGQTKSQHFLNLLLDSNEAQKYERNFRIF